MGRRKTPNAILKSRGSSKARKDEPEFTGGFGDPPETLGEIGQEQWRRVASELEQVGVGSVVDRTALECYCRAVQDFHEANQDIEEHGRVIKGERGIMRNPAFMNQKAAMDQIHKFGIQLGMTPASRGNLKAAPKQKENPFDEFRSE